MIFFATRLNSKKLNNKHKKGLIKKIYRGIYVDEFLDIKTYIEVILKHLNIEGVLYYKSAIEYPKNITNNTLYILTTKINKKIIFGNNEFRIEIFKIPKNISLIQRELKCSWNEKILIPNFYYGVLVNFNKSNLFIKRANKNLACELIIQNCLKNFKDIKYIEIYMKNIKNYAKQFNMENEYQNLELYFDKYFLENYKEYDEKRVKLFYLIKEQLEQTSFEIYPKTHKNILFYEAYFSNYIEGTEFEIDEAEKIIFNPSHRYKRDQDGHDIKSTYEIISQIYEKPILFNNFEQFIKALKNTHIKLMSHRANKITVGDFKKVVNISGNIRFVLPSQIITTLKKGYEIYATLQNPIEKAIFIHLLIAEVHPFDDGNGRISRIFMNNELSSANASHIIIPTVFRDDYITALKGFSHQNNPKPIIKALIKAYKITASINWNDKRTNIKKFIYNNSGFEKDTNGIWGVKPNLHNKSLSIGEFTEIIS